MLMCLLLIFRISMCFYNNLSVNQLCNAQGFRWLLQVFVTEMEYYTKVS